MQSLRALIPTTRVCFHHHALRSIAAARQQRLFSHTIQASTINHPSPFFASDNNNNNSSKESNNEINNNSIVNNSNSESNNNTISNNSNSSNSEALTNGLQSSDSSDTLFDERGLEVRPSQLGDEDNYTSVTHYFDTNKIYTGLRFSGFTEGQAEIIMRAMRDILTARLEAVREESIAQAAADNEAYLFEAARSELRTEVQKLRELQSAEYGSSLARLQRDVEIAHQELNESITTMKSGIDLDINERKNSNQQEASMVDMRLQELNNRISIDIVSDMKSEIEALRWQTTRRGLTAVTFVLAAMLIGISLGKKNEKENKRKPVPVAKGAEIPVPMLTSTEDEINYLEEKQFAVETLNEIQK
ncbi:hypothetical protein D0Z00_000388 [Geotrichum galactomycetum]|uniref:Uncharacterized protein n=1 Tax=Geotrichum galactomycetum TaxID=27317 RepID=A0ACB6V9Y3_9ASCO|nr:hypothetical protein D0Z00_000388 [Geotrichum candidum]